VRGGTRTGEEEGGEEPKSTRKERACLTPVKSAQPNLGRKGICIEELTFQESSKGESTKRGEGWNQFRTNNNK